MVTHHGPRPCLLTGAHCMCYHVLCMCYHGIIHGNPTGPQVHSMVCETIYCLVPSVCVTMELSMITQQGPMIHEWFLQLHSAHWVSDYNLISVASLALYKWFNAGNQCNIALHGWLSLQSKPSVCKCVFRSKWVSVCKCVCRSRRASKLL